MLTDFDGVRAQPAFSSAKSSAKPSSNAAKVSTATVSTPAVAAADKTSTTAAPELPPGWTMAKSRSTGHPYYLEVTTGKTQWNVPTVAPAQSDVQQPQPDEPAAATAASSDGGGSGGSQPSTLAQMLQQKQMFEAAVEKRAASAE